MNLEKIKIGVRLGVGFGVLMCLLVAMALLGLNGLNRANESLHHLADVNVVKIELLDDMSESIHVVARVIRTIALLHDDREAEIQGRKITAAREEFDRSIEALQKMPLDEAGRGYVEKIKEQVGAARVTNDKFMELSKSNPDEAVKHLLSSAIPVTAALQNTLHEFADLQKAKNKRDEEAASQVYRSAVTAMAAGALAALIASGVFGFLIARSILRQLGGEPDYTVQVANKIAQGDLVVQIDTRSNDKSSVLYAIKIMRDSLADICSQVHAATHTISSASGQIASGNLDLSSRTEHQASSLEETASSMEELTSTVKLNAGNATEANKLAEQASEFAEKGGEVVDQVVDTMSSINESSRKIVDIIAVIDGIAFQTNILALNAAVEAARAGEQGRGFAVVAAEVRNLAQRSAAAAKEIKALIGDSVEKVDAGTRLVDQAGATMHRIVDSVKGVSNLIAEIAGASGEQSEGIEQINQAIGQMDEVTQQNAALVEQAAAAARALQEQANELSKVVGVFKLSAEAELAPSVAVPVNTGATRPILPTRPAPVLGRSQVHALAQKRNARTLAAIAPLAPSAPVAKLPSSSSSSRAVHTTADGWDEF
ncbi:MAG: MCP four helix bundle domain-containing protein [Burkholderiaceae bacterium]|nr:MCP four helix bundle domain-containing protein [Burkholderiaceae bacterium]